MPCLNYLLGGNKVKMDVTGEDITDMDAAKFFTAPAALLAVEWRAGFMQFHF